MADDGGVLEYHRLTSHAPQQVPVSDPRLRTDIRPMDPSRRPPPWKTYADVERFDLPDDVFDVAGWGLPALARILHLSAGVVRVAGSGRGTVHFRAAGSAGNLQPVEVYVATGGVDALPSGVWHYAPDAHALDRVADGAGSTGTALVLTGVPWRTGWKYTERGYRHLWWDAGSMTAQVLELAADLGIDGRVDVAFVDTDVAGAVGAQRPHEVPLAVVRFTPEAAVGSASAARGSLGDDLEAFPLVERVHREGDFASADEVDEWRRRAGASGRPVGVGGGGTPRGADAWSSRSLTQTILARGSTREFRGSGPAPAALLTDTLAWAARAVPGDFHAADAALGVHYVLVHAVRDHEPGVYRLDPEGLRLLGPLTEDDARALGRVLCLGQQLGGSGAFTVFHCAPLEDVVAVLGARGWRAAHLEAGVVSGRVHLGAFASGYGATGLTFFDELVRQAFGITERPLLVTAVGEPAYRSRPGGAPRAPTRLRGR